MWTSSQSSTAARSDPSTIRLPIRKSPCTSRRGRRRRPVSGQPTKNPFERRGGIAHLVEPGTPLIELIGLGQAHTERICAMDRGQCGAHWLQQPLAARLVEAAVNLAGNGFSGDRVARPGTDCPVPPGNRPRPGREVPGARPRRPVPGQPPPPPCSRVRHLAGRCAGSVLAALRRQSRRRPMSSGWRRRSTDAGSRRRHRRRGLGRARRRGRWRVRRSRQRFRPNPKSRWATRRIWISSAPSVIRYRR